MRMIVKKWNSFLSISRSQKILFLKVVALSIYREILFALGSQKAFSEKILCNFPKQLDSSKKIKKAEEIAFAIKLASKYIPWNNRCRHQSWQAIYLLNQMKIPYVYQVGVKKNNSIEGHSWVKVGERFISGFCRVSDYNLIR